MDDAAASSRSLKRIAISLGNAPLADPSSGVYATGDACAKADNGTMNKKTDRKNIWCFTVFTGMTRSRFLVAGFSLRNEASIASPRVAAIS